MKYCPNCGREDIYLQSYVVSNKNVKYAGCYDCWWFGDKTQLMNEIQKIKFDRKHKLIKINYENKKWVCK